jgi:hypothetical protein
MTIPCRSPFEAKTNRITGAPELYLAEPSEPAVALPAPVAAVIRILDRLEQARILSGAIRQSVEWTQTYFALSRERGFRSEMGGLFSVTRPFDAVGTHFERGMLLDRSVLTEGMLERHWKGRSLQPVAGDAMIAAA